MSGKHWCQFLLVSLLFFFDSSAQDSSKQSYFRLIKKIQLKDIKPELNSLEINSKDSILYLVSTKNNLITAIHLLSGHILATISEIKSPRKVCYIADKDELLITTGTSKCFFYSSKSYKQVARINVMSPSNSAIYDEESKKIYIGDEESLNLVDVKSHKVKGFIPFYSEPKNLLINRSKNRIYVNLSDWSRIAVVDIDLFKTATTWKSDYLLKDALEIDTINQQVFAATDQPAKLIVTTAVTGKKAYINLPIPRIQNINFDSRKNRLYISGDEKILILEKSPTGFRIVSYLHAEGGINLSNFIPSLRLFTIIRAGHLKGEKELLIYHVE